MKKKKMHILYEYGQDFRPHGSAYIRLLQPLSHPAVSSHLQVSHGIALNYEPYDVVIVDRFWRPDVDLEMAVELLNQIRLVGAKFIYAIDDNFFDIPKTHASRIRPEYIQVADYFVRKADQVLVTTPNLQKKLSVFNSNFLLVPNQLDERLLVTRNSNPYRLDTHGIKLGYMGTLTHDEDLLTILPALKAVFRRHPKLTLEIIGVAGHPATQEQLRDLPVEFLNPPLDEVEYPLFMLWFTSHVHWDIAIAPLLDSPFTRCKSDIKFLDYCAIAAAGIYSHVPAYESSVQPGETGLLVENTTDAWEQALEELIANQELCHHLQWSAYQYLHQHRVLRTTYTAWLNALLDTAND